jgi:preprotein translocase subunit SecE
LVERRSPKPKVGGSNPSAPAIALEIEEFMLKVLEFIGQVKEEVRKITWSSKKETVMSVIMVVVVVFFASLFFLLVDMGVYKVVQLLLNLGVS